VDVGNTHTISGCVSDGGSPVSDIWIGFGTGIPAARTDASGCYSRKVADGTHTVSAESERWNVWPAEQEVTVSGADVSNVDFDAESYRVMPGYSTSFDDGRLGPAWTRAGDGYGRADVMDCPHTGDHALVMDHPAGGSFVTAGTYFRADLSCRSDATLTFWWRENGDESNGSDGVYIRRNSGDSWCKIFSLTGNGGTYEQEVINLNTEANGCWGSPSLTSEFQILFQQYDNVYWPGGDGIAIDDVSISATGGTYTWDGSTDSNWNEPSNWDVGCVPGPTDNVVIPSGVPNWPNVNGPGYANDLTIQDGAHLDSLSGASLNIYGDWTDSGSGFFNGSSGTVIFRGSGAQAVTANASSDFYHFQVGDGSASSSVTLNSNLDANGNVAILSGATLAGGANTIYVGGNWNDNGTWTRGTSHVIFDGTTQTAGKQVAPSTVNLLGPEDFEGSFPPTGWTRVDDAGGGARHWELNTTYGAANRTNGSGNSAASRGDSSNNGVTWDNRLRTPSVSVPAGAGSVTLSYESNFQDYAGNGDAYLDISTNGGGSWTNLTHWTADYGPTHEDVDLSSYAGQNIMLRWRYTANTNRAWYWQIDDVVISAFVPGIGSLEFYDLTVTSGNIATFGGNVSVDDNLVVDPDAIMDVGTYDITSVGGTVTNNGAIRQTKNAPSTTTTSFVMIPTGKYYGVDIYPTSGDMGSTTVTVYGNRSCPDSGSSAVERCFEIDPGTDRTADITFYYCDPEENGNTVADPWHWNGSSWDAETCLGRDRSGVDDNWVQAGGVTAYSPFGLADNNPTAVRLLSFVAVPASEGVLLSWETENEVNNLGFNLYCSESYESLGEQLNEDLIPSGSPGGEGAVYEYLDATAQSSGTYYYTLEDVDASGRRTQHGPLILTLWRAYLPLVHR
jgi:hypothetical protein